MFLCIYKGGTHLNTNPFSNYKHLLEVNNRNQQMLKKHFVALATLGNPSTPSVDLSSIDLTASIYRATQYFNNYPSKINDINIEILEIGKLEIYIGVTLFTNQDDNEELDTNIISHKISLFCRYLYHKENFKSLSRYESKLFKLKIVKVPDAS